MMEKRCRGRGCGIEHVRNPIVLARAVMEKSSMSDDWAGAEKFPKRNGIELVDVKYFFTQDRGRVPENKSGGESWR